MNIRISHVLLALLVVLVCGCKKEEAATDTAATDTGTTPTVAAEAEGATVLLRFTGISHLIGKNGDKTRLLVMPNHTGQNHKTLLLVPDTLEAQFSATAKQKEVGEITYNYVVIDPGITIDLEASKAENTGGLTFNEPADAAGEKDECPKERNDSTGTPEDSLHWLPRLSVVTNKPKLKVKDAYMKPQPKPEDVAVRLELKGGRLSAELLPEVSRFRFQRNGPQNGDHIQAVGKELKLELSAELVDGFFVLKAQRFDAKPEEMFELVRVKPVQNNVELMLANVVENDFFNPKKIDKGKPIPHFEHYYATVEDPDDAKFAKAIPIKGEICRGGISSETECGPDRQP